MIAVGGPVLLVVLGLATGVLTTVPPETQTCADTIKGVTPDKWQSTCDGVEACCFDVSQRTTTWQLD